MDVGHRLSFDHDHVLTDLMSRYEAVLEAAEATEGWATSVKASRPPMTLMGSLGGIEAGLRQLRWNAADCTSGNASPRPSTRNHGALLHAPSRHTWPTSVRTVLPR